MTRSRTRTILAVVCLAVLFHGHESFAAEKNSHPAKPNIIFIIVDDFGSRDLSCYGSKFYETPNMDRLASQGMRFTEAYAAYPRCVPSRFAMMTGKYPARQQGSSDGMKITQEVTIGRALKEGGYTTFFCGKWHLGAGESAPEQKGFDVAVAAGAAGRRVPTSRLIPSREKAAKLRKQKSPGWTTLQKMNT